MLSNSDYNRPIEKLLRTLNAFYLFRKNFSFFDVQSCGSDALNGDNNIQ